MSLKFIPPKEDVASLPRYASYVVGSGMKLHGQLNAAKNSWRNRGWTRRIHPDKPKIESYGGLLRDNWQAVTLHGFILENVDGDWYVLYEIKPNLTEDQLPWMKEYYYSYGWNLLTDSIKSNSYYGPKLKAGEYKTEFRPTPMTRDEYVAWRLEIQKEQLGITS